MVMKTEPHDRGLWLPGSREALAELRARAERAIASGDAKGRDVRQTMIRLRDEMGHLLFEGTMQEAASGSFAAAGVSSMSGRRLH
ncbi:hypothetical protein P7D22_06580 [Lichenihabitans sp. Uapishka_5]|uniref:hypothetical protein n=1 Tax=Lichenihabitans sp. Uapishka_5 TaxID=3037302 RepID=UPI0029E80A44|nr:hypothetical protein [Lichenihabitans sp. Uapishka_5]MDX7950843.1 hypothetical protein [Lichenihabitans sp. Uapishka_5]